MNMRQLARRIEKLEKRVKEQDDAIDRLRNENDSLKNHVAELETENEKPQELLQQKAEGKASKKPKFAANYSIQRNEPGDPKSAKTKKERKPSTCRVPNALKTDKAD